jgi:hypothetical protein
MTHSESAIAVAQNHSEIDQALLSALLGIGPNWTVAMISYHFVTHSHSLIYFAQESNSNSGHWKAERGGRNGGTSDATPAALPALLHLS